MNLPKEFKPMTQWQAVINFANALLGEEKFTTDHTVESVIAFMNQPEREHHKKQYLENWVESLFLHEKT
ncbi:MAG: hypothetical protein ACRYGR_09890 [Janthinobacterium lividum]